jgi:hypothetical protein
MKIAVYLTVSLATRLLAGPADAETLTYKCAVGGVDILLRIDTEILTVSEVSQKDGITEVARYSDGVFGPVSDVGAARMIPPVHQFVRIDDQRVYFGAELRGEEDSAVLDRRRATLTIPNGDSGGCSQIGAHPIATPDQNSPKVRQAH